MSESPCPLCKKPAQLEGEHPVAVDCAWCGRYTISDTPESIASSTDEDTLHWLSCCVRQASDEGREISINAGNREKLADGPRKMSMDQKMDKLIRLIGSASKEPGAAISLEQQDILQVNARSVGELTYLANALKEQGLVKGRERWDTWEITPVGWRHLGSPEVHGNSRRVFVAMWFTKEMDEAYDLAILPAIEQDAKLECIPRSDRAHFTERIDDRILNDITRCDFLVADCSGHRPNVYFEAGFALGLGREVIWTCRQSDLETEHFDTRQYPRLLWNNLDELRSLLSERLINLIELRRRRK